MSDTMERIKKVTANVLKIKAGTPIGDTALFAKDLGASSIQSVELVAAFEEEFDLEMDEDQALSVKSVKDAAEFIDRLLKA